MNKISFYSALIIIIAGSFFLGYITHSSFSAVNPPETPCKAHIIEHHINPSDENLSQIDLYDMEHNFLIGSSQNTSLYLDNTSDTDTIHIYLYTANYGK